MHRQARLPEISDQIAQNTPVLKFGSGPPPSPENFGSWHFGFWLFRTPPHLRSTQKFKFRQILAPWALMVGVCGDLSLYPPRIPSSWMHQQGNHILVWSFNLSSRNTNSSYFYTYIRPIILMLNFSLFALSWHKTVLLIMCPSKLPIVLLPELGWLAICDQLETKRNVNLLLQVDILVTR